MSLKKLLIGSTLVCSIALASKADAQLSRVDQYGVTTFQATWDSLRTGTATLAPYVGGPNEGKYSITLPFTFPFDGVIVPPGIDISVGANGAISFAEADIPPQQLVGNEAYDGLIAPFNGDLKQGSDAKAEVADSSGLYQVTGTSPDQVLTIEWRAFHLRGGGSGQGQVDTLTSMQVKLYETSGVIEFIYRDHGLDLPTKFPARMCIGLNGAPIPDFRSNLYMKDTKVIPATDLRWTPGTASVQVSRDAALQVFPNPATNAIRLSLAEQVDVIEAIDALGRSFTLTSVGGAVDVSHLPAGLYTLRVNLGDRTEFTKLMIAR